MQYLYAALIGLMGGVTGGMFGVGGGIVMVPAMIVLLKMEPKIAVGTSLVVIVAIALVGSFRHHTFAQVDWRIVLLLVPTALLGGWYGPEFAKALSGVALKRGFACLLLLAAGKLLISK